MVANLRTSHAKEMGYLLLFPPRAVLFLKGKADKSHVLPLNPSSGS